MELSTCAKLISRLTVVLFGAFLQICCAHAASPIRFPVEGDALSVAWSPDGRLLASSSSNFALITIWDATTGKPFRQLDRHAVFGESLVFFSGGKYLLTSMAAQDIIEARRTAVSVWDVGSGTIAKQVSGPYSSSELGSNRADVFALSGDGRFLAVVTHGRPPGVIAIYDPSNWTLVRTLSLGTDIPISIAASPDGRWLAIGTIGSVIAIFDSSDWNLVHSIEAYKGAGSGVRSLAFSPNGHLIASVPSVTGGKQDPDGSVHANIIPDALRIWNIGDARLVQSMSLKLEAGRGGTARGVAWSPDGHHIATASDDHIVRVWDTEKLDAPIIIATFAKIPWGVAFSPDGKRLAAAGDGAVIIANLDH